MHGIDREITSEVIELRSSRVGRAAPGVGGAAAPASPICPVFCRWRGEPAGSRPRSSSCSAWSIGWSSTRPNGVGFRGRYERLVAAVRPGRGLGSRLRAVARLARAAGRALARDPLCRSGCASRGRARTRAARGLAAVAAAARRDACRPVRSRRTASVGRRVDPPDEAVPKPGDLLSAELERSARPGLRGRGAQA